MMDYNITKTFLGAFLVAFLAALALGPRTIAALRVLKFGQNINTDAPERHMQKQGTPTMGGVLILLGTLVPFVIALAVPGLRARISPQLIAVLLVFVANAAIGFLDDWLNIKRGRSLGLRAREKMALQFMVAIGFALWLMGASEPQFTTVVQVWPHVHVDLGYGYYVLVVLFMVFLSNATNFTDGLDGLLGGTTVLASLGVALTIFTLHTGLAIVPAFGYALAGAAVGFLWYNAHPAKVFMGDTGSLAIGAGLTAMAVVGKQEVLLLIFCLVFIAEIVSVMIQVAVFKATGGKGKGRRVFKMTPIHHHFELSGWEETRVVARFWIVGGIALALGLLAAPYLAIWVSP